MTKKRWFSFKTIHMLLKSYCWGSGYFRRIGSILKNSMIKERFRSNSTKKTRSFGYQFFDARSSSKFDHQFELSSNRILSWLAKTLIDRTRRLRVRRTLKLSRTWIWSIFNFGLILVNRYRQLLLFACLLWFRNGHLW